MHSLDIQRFQLENPGIVIKPADPKKRLWLLFNIVIHKKISNKETGNFVIMACNKTGVPVETVEFIVGWHDTIVYPIQEYAGRFSMILDRVYDPIIESGPYWTGFIEQGIGDEIYGLGIPKGHKCDIKIIYTQYEGGA